MTAVFLGAGLMLLGAIAAAFAHRRPVFERAHVLLVVAGCLTTGSAAVVSLVSARFLTSTVQSAMPGGNWVFTLDPLSALFLLGVSIVGATSVAYSVPYLAPERTRVSTAVSHAILAIVLAAMSLMATAQSVLPFLATWEIMAVGSYFLIVHEYERAESRRAGLIYLVATHTGTLVLVAMFAFWSGPAPNWSFAALAEATPRIPHGAAAILSLAVFGFGFKAGLVPLHFWLPSAHASAPSHVSALMSGIVIKSGIYGILRVLTLVGGVPPIWWGWMVLSLGLASGVLGVLWALAQHDIKRLLAYHSVENIGIILIGIGVGSLGAAYQQPIVAVLGFAGALLHTMNHALFKSLLFLGAGAVQRATGTRDMERLGGLASRLRSTWLVFFIGATAIIGLPPLNGFVSEWLVYLGLFSAGQARDALRLAAFGIPALALIGALALACFAKVSAVVFLGHPRSQGARDATEVARSLRIPMFVLAGGCLALGMWPPLGVVPALRAAAVVWGRPLPVAGLDVVVAGARTVSVVAVGVVTLFAVLWFARWLLVRGRRVRADATWGCGYTAAVPRAQYTASSFAAPLLSTFGRLSGVVEYRDAHSFHTEPVDLVLDRVALPLWRRAHRVAQRLRTIQQGRLHMYLLYVMLALVVLLAYLAIFARA